MSLIGSNIDYEVAYISPLEFKIFKFRNGFQEIEYSIVYKNGEGWSCNCPARQHRGHCKHELWVELIREGETVMLPIFVRVGQTIDVNRTKIEILYTLKQLAKKKAEAKNAKEKNTE